MEEASLFKPKDDVVPDGSYQGNVLVATDTNQQMTRALVYEYNVLYSQSYSVPILYCNIYKQGELITSLINLYHKVFHNRMCIVHL